MSSTLPPSGPPSGPTWGAPPSGPPAGWEDASAEVLQSGRGGPIPPMPPASGGPGGSGRGGRRARFIAGGALVGVGLLGAGAWAGYTMFFATGAQPAEALPDTTVAYVSVDLDPSGKQKLAALETLEKFPAFAENIDLSVDDDLRLRLFEQIQGEAVCPDIDFADVEPWLGNRLGVAAVDAGDGAGLGGSGITGVGVIQVDDAAAAEEGLAALSACGGEGDAFGWSVAGDWAVVAETTEIAEQVTEAAADAPLAGDDDFQRWTDEAGDAGILTAYVAPEAGELVAEAAAGFGALSSLAGLSPLDCLPRFGTDPFADSPFAGAPAEACVEPFPLGGAGLPIEQLAAVLQDFEGAALTIRFAGGGLELEAATGSGLFGAATAGGGGDDVVAGLPVDTAAALGIGVEDDFLDQVLESADGVLGESGFGGLLESAAQATGLDLPADIQTLLGDSFAVVLGGDADLAAFDEPDPPADLELGIAVEGDADAIGDVLDRLVDATGDASLAPLLAYGADGDTVAVGPSGDYRAALLADGGLGDTDAYRDAVMESEDAAAVLFVDFDAGSWLDSIPGLEPEIRANLEPLSALGLSSWADDGVQHGALRITTE